jgi:arsenate reductase (thioredoxin)
MKIQTILVLCTGNSCRSQIAEGFLRYFAQGRADVYSAGIEAHGLNPNAIATMNAIGMDISKHTSNKIDDYLNVNFDYIITVCDNAKENCPYFPSKAKIIHHSFPDPAKFVGSSADTEVHFAEVRDQIQSFCSDFVDTYINQSA